MISLLLIICLDKCESKNNFVYLYLYWSVQTKQTEQMLVHVCFGIWSNKSNDKWVNAFGLFRQTRQTKWEAHLLHLVCSSKPNGTNGVQLVFHLVCPNKPNKTNTFVCFAVCRLYWAKQTNCDVPNAHLVCSSKPNGTNDFQLLLHLVCSSKPNGTNGVQLMFHLVCSSKPKWNKW